MDPFPTKTSLPELVLSRLRAGVEDGEWEDRLPAERELSAALQVSRPTLRLALEQLKKEGWLEVQGKRTLIRKRRSRRTKDTLHTRKIVFLSPVPLEGLTSLGLLLYGELCRRLAPLGGTLQLATIPPGRSNLDRRLDELARKTKAEAWILYRCPEEIHRHFQQMAAPTVVFGNSYRDIDLPALEIDYGAALRHCLAQLQRLSHEPSRIALVLPDSRLAGHIAIETIFADALGTDAKLQIIRHHESGDNVSQVFQRALRRTHAPTAVIVLRTSVATAIHGLATHDAQLSIPGDLSLVSLEDSPFMTHLVPEISRYTVDSNRIAQIVFSILSRQLASGIRKSWGHRPPVPEFIEGATLARPR